MKFVTMSLLQKQLTSSPVGTIRWLGVPIWVSVLCGRQLPYTWGWSNGGCRE